MLDHWPQTEDSLDELGRSATSALRTFLAHVVDFIPPYRSRDQYLLIYGMEAWPLEHKSSEPEAPQSPVPAEGWADDSPGCHPGWLGPVC